MSDYLDQYSLKRILLDVSEDDDLSEEIDIVGYELVAVITPAALDGATNDITPQFDPGTGTFYTPLNKDGSDITWWENVEADEWLQAPATDQKLVGAKLKLSFSEAEDADREFFAVLVKLHG